MLGNPFSDKAILPLRNQNRRSRHDFYGSLSKFSQIPGVSFFQTVTGTDPPKPRFIAHLGIGEKHQSYSLGFIFSNLARNTVDISWYDTRKSPTGCSWGPNDLNSTQAWLGNGWIHSKLMGPTTENVGFYRKKMHKKKKHGKQKKYKPDRQKKTKEQNSKTEGNPGFELFWFLCWFVFLIFCFSRHPSSQFVYLVNLLLILFLLFFSVVLLKSTFSVPVGLIILNHSMILLHLLPGTTKVCDAKVLFQQRKNLARHPEIICMSVRVCMNMI